MMATHILSGIFECIKKIDNHSNPGFYFLLIGTNDEYDEDKIYCLYSWLFKNNDMVRYRLGGSSQGHAGYSLKQFYDRRYITIPNKENDLLYFKKWRIDDRHKFYDGNGS